MEGMMSVQGVINCNAIRSALTSQDGVRMTVNVQPPDEKSFCVYAELNGSDIPRQRIAASIESDLKGLGLATERCVGVMPTDPVVVYATVPGT